MTRFYTIILMSCCSLLLGACSAGGDNADLQRYVDETKARPAGAIDAIPTFKPFEPYVYSATALRSPFDRPLAAKQRLLAKSNSNLKPNFDRRKELLESFDLTQVKMVGTLSKDATLWALLSDPTGTIHWVRDGNYVGKNHGRIIATEDSKVELVEIVSDGLDGWVERPRIIALSEE